jgi:alkylhydroperoxidase family enzyme
VRRNSFLGAIRTRSSLPTSIREVAISRVATLNQAWYEWIHHAPLLRETGVISEAAIKFLLDAPPTHKGDISEIPMDEKHALVMQYADASTKDIEIPDGIFKRMEELFSHQEIVEITATIGAYNCVSRFLVALNVGEMNGKKPEK